jgi:hypothetical protein
MKIVYNAIKTPDGTVLVSRYRHDYVSHHDTLSGEYYILDGGLDYRRTSVNEVPAEDLTVYLEDGIEAFRNLVSWGTYGKDGKDALKQVVLADMDTDHIQAVLDTQEYMDPILREAFEMELIYRNA